MRFAMVFLLLIGGCGDTDSADATVDAGVDSAIRVDAGMDSAIRVDAGMDSATDSCPAGWHSAEYYTEPGCSPPPEPQQVCAPNTWDASCNVTCACSGEQICGLVWASGDGWDYGASVPYSGPPADGGKGCEAIGDAGVDG